MSDVMKQEEKAIYSLRALYHRYGYSQFKMSKFEPYELYMQNKDFLVSDGIITFTDTDGTLMALKPDVTLSIVKNFRPDTVLQKVYYSENVYRITGAVHTYREIMQTGLECLGAVTDYDICEVILLAAKSLQQISPAFVLDISHMQIISDFVEQISLAADQKSLVLQAIAEKNEDALIGLCKGLPESQTRLLVCLLQTNGSMNQMLPNLESLCETKASQEALDQMKRIYSIMDNHGLSDHLYVDFSMVNDMNYYNGIVFRGYVQGIPTGILSGGQYDKLMEKMGKPAKGIGFAVYLDQLERLDLRKKEYDVDFIILYNDKEDIAGLFTEAENLSKNGSSVMVLTRLPENLRCRTKMQYKDGRLISLETNG